MKKSLSQTLNEFADFIRSKGVIGLAVGLVIGLAITALVQAIVDGLIGPLIGTLLPQANNLEEATLTIGEGVYRWGAVSSALINFIIIAAIVFFSFKWLNLDDIDIKSET